MSRRILLLLWVAGGACHPSSAPSPQPVRPRVTAAERAVELERKAEQQVLGGDSSGAAEASKLWAQAGQEWRDAGNDSSSAAAFDRAGVLARRAGQTDSAFLHFGSALQARDSLAEREVRDLLGSSPLPTRDAGLEASFVGTARALLVKLGILELAEARVAIRSAVEAYDALENLAAGSKQIVVSVKSDSVPHLEVRMRRWITQYKNAPWTTLRTDTALVRPPMQYEFCYIDPKTGNPMLFAQPCADGCQVVLPSAYASKSSSGCVQGL